MCGCDRPRVYDVLNPFPGPVTSDVTRVRRGLPTPPRRPGGLPRATIPGGGIELGISGPGFGVKVRRPELRALPRPRLGPSYTPYGGVSQPEPTGSYSAGHTAPDPVGCIYETIPTIADIVRST